MKEATMPKIVSIHEHELKPGIDAGAFERTIQDAVVAMGSAAPF